MIPLVFVVLEFTGADAASLGSLRDRVPALSMFTGARIGAPVGVVLGPVPAPSPGYSSNGLFVFTSSVSGKMSGFKQPDFSEYRFSGAASLKISGGVLKDAPVIVVGFIRSDLLAFSGTKKTWVASYPIDRQSYFGYTGVRIIRNGACVTVSQQALGMQFSKGIVVDTTTYQFWS